jgi:heterodisulfide reductase subunit A
MSHKKGAVKGKERVGVFLCECGPNIKDAMDLDNIARFARGLKNVVFAEAFPLLCAREAKDVLSKKVRKHRLTRVVFAACSPKEHERTFREILKEGGLNPFLFQAANIREQCAWVVPERSLATAKAKVVIAAAVKRVLEHEPLETKEVACQPDVLVVGAGVAGISAALTLAQRNRKVYLVERLPCIGGKVGLCEAVFPNMECGSCLLEPLLDSLLHHQGIELLTMSEVQEVLGFYGNFLVKVKKRARYVDPETCIGCGACLEACPVTVKNEYAEGLDERKAVHIAYAGSLPNLAFIDARHCLRWQGKVCEACKEACPFGSINYEDADEEAALHVGAMVIATGFDLFDVKKAPEYGYGDLDSVYTSLEFERILNANGPTAGEIVLRNGRTPKSIAFIHCVGSRTAAYHRYCSGVCCSYLFKFARQVIQKLPHVSIMNFYSDLCLPGKEGQLFFDNLSQEANMKTVRLKMPDGIAIREDSGRTVIRYKDVGGRWKTKQADMVVLAPAMEGAKGAEEVSRTLGIPLGEGGFFAEAQTSLAPVSTAADGIFVAGCAQGPKDIQGAIAQGQAAAGCILSRLVPGEKLILEGATAEVDPELCSGCQLCVGLCPYGAIQSRDGGASTEVNEILCRGCGICAAGCPSGAIRAKHFTDAQVSAEIKALGGE